MTEAFEIISSSPFVKGACQAVECPPHSSSKSGYVSPDGCVCADGYSGSISLGDPYEGECVQLPCPENAKRSRHTGQCHCSEGFEPRDGTCQVVQCPEEVSTGSNVVDGCKCLPGCTFRFHVTRAVHINESIRTQTNTNILNKQIREK